MPELMDITVDELIEEMELCWDWDERYRYLLELGRKLPPMSEAEKNEENLIHGCQSTAWMIARVVENGRPRIELIADSDSQIVQGLIAVVLIAFSGKTADEILNFDIEALFEKLELRRHLSPVRGNGLRAMVAKVRDLARQVKETE